MQASQAATDKRRLGPYCLQRRRDGKYIVLNRRYKPVDWPHGKTWADYDAWPKAFAIQITPEMATAISWKGDPNTDRVYLYNDGCLPETSPEFRIAYRRRLDLLGQHGVLP